MRREDAIKIGDQVVYNGSVHDVLGMAGNDISLSGDITVDISRENLGKVIY